MSLGQAETKEICKSGPFISPYNSPTILRCPLHPSLTIDHLLSIYIEWIMALETPRSPPPSSPLPPSSKDPASPQAPPTVDIEMTDPPPLPKQPPSPSPMPAFIPFEHHPTDLLPDLICKTFPNGNPVAFSRSPEQLAALEARKNEYRRTMTVPEMQKRYQQVARELVERLEENESKKEEWRDAVVKAEEDFALQKKVARKVLEKMAVDDD